MPQMFGKLDQKIFYGIALLACVTQICLLTYLIVWGQKPIINYNDLCDALIEISKHLEDEEALVYIEESLEETTNKHKNVLCEVFVQGWTRITEYFRMEYLTLKQMIEVHVIDMQNKSQKNLMNMYFTYFIAMQVIKRDVDFDAMEMDLFNKILPEDPAYEDQIKLDEFIRHISKINIIN